MPTLSEVGFPGFDSRLWIGVFGRPDLPPDVVSKIEQATRVALDSAEVMQALKQQGIAPLLMSRSQFSDFIVKEIGLAKATLETSKRDTSESDAIGAK